MNGFLTLATLCDSPDCLIPATDRCHGCASQFCVQHAGIEEQFCPECGSSWADREASA